MVERSVRVMVEVPTGTLAVLRERAKKLNSTPEAVGGDLLLKGLECGRQHRSDKGNG